MENNNQKYSSEKKTVVYVNYNIRGSHVRVIENGQMPRVMKIDAAVEYAKSLNMDLVQISYDKTNHLAVCKIQNYGKFKYEQQKKEKAAKKAARAAQADVKEVCFSIRIDDGDKQTKINHIAEFLSDGKTKVKLTIKLSKREMNLLGMAKDMMREILTHFEGKAELDSNPSFNSGIMSCVIRPIKT